MITEPRTKPLVVRRSTSMTFPATSRNAPISAMSAATGSDWAAPSASPILIASEIEFLMVPSRACATVSEYSVDAALPPNSTAAARSSRSIQCPEMVRKAIRFPRSSVITAGLGEIPARCMATWGTSGKARPMPSASSTGRPIRAAQEMGTRPLEPPISAGISAATLRPVMNSRFSRSRSPSSPARIFSMLTVGAPIIPQGMISSSSGSSSRSTRATGP
jgi:hypothetical protein